MSDPEIVDPEMRWKYEIEERFKAPDLPGPGPVLVIRRAKNDQHTQRNCGPHGVETQRRQPEPP